MSASGYTVIIPAFNSGETIERAIRSAFAQDLPPSEVIVIDDASTDQTAQIAMKAKARVLKNTTNLGSCRSRMVGVIASKTPLVGFLDSDDTWDSDLALKATRLLSENSADIVGCQLRPSGSTLLKAQILALEHRSANPANGARLLGAQDFKHGSPFANSGTIMRTSLAKDLLPRVTARYAEDYWVLIMAFVEGKKLWLLPEQLGTYYLSENQKSVSIKNQVESRGLALDYLFASDIWQRSKPESLAFLKLKLVFSYWAGLANIKKGPPEILKIYWGSQSALNVYLILNGIVKTVWVWSLVATLWRFVVVFRRSLKKPALESIR
jgi:glycosyltransferase involved in cell wall biosynthesis